MAKTITLSDGLQYIPIISKRFTCPKCRIFCMELTPVYTKGLLTRLRAQGKSMPPTKIYCKNGCHFHPGWGWKNFDWDKIRDVNEVSEWPDEWKTGRDDERRVRR